MTPPCAPVTSDVVRAAVGDTSAPDLPPLPGLSDTPTDPTCPGSRHGSVRAYRAHHCRCPEVIAHVLADAEREKAKRAADRAAGIRPRPADEVDALDVEAAMWAAWRWRPIPETLTDAEVKTVVMRLRRKAMSVREISARTGLDERRVARHLEQARCIADVVQAARTGAAMPDGLTLAVQQAAALWLAGDMPAGDIAERIGARPSLVDRWLKRQRQLDEQAATEAARLAADLVAA